VGRLTASVPFIAEPRAEVRKMTVQQLLNVLMCSPAEAKPCTRLGADRLEWLRPAASRLADRRMAAEEEMRARRMCARCPVRDECLELSLRGRPVEGVQGGATERSRQTLHHRRRSPNPAALQAANSQQRVSRPGGQTPGQLPAGSGSPTTSR
jgi:WhiB family redox-sensing transcriptional regulator